MKLNCSEVELWMPEENWQMKSGMNNDGLNEGSQTSQEKNEASSSSLADQLRLKIEWRLAPAN